MAIEEKSRVLEFTYTPDIVGCDIEYDISYDKSKGTFPLTVNSGGSNISYPLDLFTEVVEFLSSKGVIEPQVLSRTVAPHGEYPPIAIKASVLPTPRSPVRAPIPARANIPIPQVTKSDGESFVHTSNVDPLASFDITTPLISADFKESSIPPTAELVQKMTGGSPPIPKIIKADGGGIVMHSSEAQSEIPSVPVAPDTSSRISSEITSRPVIRSRVTGLDPQSAEKEAAMLRQAQGKGAGKAVRKAHRAEE